MDVFIDEAGLFTPPHRWSVVCSLCLPSKEAGPARRKIAYASRDWPKSPNGELKGGRLNADQLKKLVDQLHAHDALLHCIAVDVSSELPEQLARHKQRQCEGITAHITEEHTEQVSSKLWSLRRILEGMPIQLYIQSVAMSALSKIVVEESAAYFSQRRPQELGSYHWKVDAKDPLRITTQEKWWRDTLGPLLESACLRDPLMMIGDKDFDYRCFDKSFLFEKSLWRPNQPPRPITGYDIGKIISKSVSFNVSHSDVLLQAADIVANVIRRILNGEVTDQGIVQTIGKLQIMRKMGDLFQSVHVITLSHERDSERTGIGRMLGIMSRAGRPMIRRSRTRDP